MDVFLHKNKKSAGLITLLITDIYNPLYMKFTTIIFQF
jgi:hypothetical protein